jgi:hypothetical protein
MLLEPAPALSCRASLALPAAAPTHSSTAYAVRRCPSRPGCRPAGRNYPRLIRENSGPPPRREERAMGEAGRSG